MKKLLFLTTIFAMAMVVLTGCKKDPVDPVDPVGKTKLTLGIPTPTFKFDATTAFTVTASVKVEADLTVTLTSSNLSAATVPASVVIKAGTDQISGVITGVAEGKSTITIAASDVELTVASVEVTVTKDTPPVPEKINVSISTTFSEVAPSAKIPFTVTAATAPTADLVINVTSGNTAAATVPATVTILANQTSVSGEITGVAAGEADITLSGELVTATGGAIHVVVKEGAATAVALSITTASADVEVGMNMPFTITTPVAPAADLTINIASNNANATVSTPVVLPAGKMSVQGNITGAVIGTAVVTISSDGTTITKATVDVNVIERQNIEYGSIKFSQGYAKLNSFKLGDVTVPCEVSTLSTGSGPLSPNFEFVFNPDGGIFGEPTGARDEYTLAIYADWNRTGTLKQVWNKVFAAGAAVSTHSGTLEIPADAATTSMIRAVLFYSGEGGKLPNGVGTIESGSAVDFTYTK